MARIYSVESVNLAVLDTEPRQLLISASGLVNSSGWSRPGLTPHSVLATPGDGYVDLDFNAQPPRDVSLRATFPLIAHHVWKGELDGLRGVRIHGASNKIEKAVDPNALPQPAFQGPYDPMLVGNQPYMTGLASSPALPLPAAAPPPQAQAPSGVTILLGGTLQGDESHNGEGAGFLLGDVLVEVDANSIPDPDRFSGRQVIVEGEFQLRNYPSRGGVWTFVAEKLRTPRLSL